MGVITTTGFINRCHYRSFQGWSGGAMVLGKLPVPGRPTYLDKSRARAYCACSRCGWGLFGHFSLVYHFSFLSPYLWETAGYRLKRCLKGPLSPKQPTNQPIISSTNLQKPWTDKNDLDMFVKSDQDSVSSMTSWLG